MNSFIVILRTLSFLVIFMASVFKNELEEKNLFWIVASTGLVTYIIMEILNWKDFINFNKSEAKLKEAHQSLRMGENYFKESFKDVHLEGLEQAVESLQGALKLLSSLKGQELNKVDINHSIGLASERLAYHGCKYARIYTIVDGKLEMKTRETSKDRMIPKTPFHKTEICATEICNRNNWEEAREAYMSIWRIMSKKIIDKSNTNIIRTLLAPVRSAGYFFLCDYLVCGENTLGMARDCLTMYNNLSKKSKKQNRILDSEQKLRFLKAIETM